jgi:hypothetical protein
MENNISLKEMRNKCISCTYLYYSPSSEDIGLNNSDRKNIVDNTWDDANYQGLICYKDLLSEMYKSFSEIPYEQARTTILQATCPAKDWQLYQEGMAPRKSYQREQQNRNFKWTRSGVIVAVIGTLATLTVLGLTIYNIFFK